MNTIIIPNARSNEEYRAALDAARAEMAEKWGIDVPFLRTDTEYAWIDGTLYQKSRAKYGNKLFVWQEGEGPIAEDAPGVRCPCGSAEFTLRYGDYEIRARCAKCGTEDVVYDG